MLFIESFIWMHLLNKSFLEQTKDENLLSVYIIKYVIEERFLRLDKLHITA